MINQINFRKQCYEQNVDLELPNTTVEQLCNIVAHSFDKVSTEQVKKSYNMCGFGIPLDGNLDDEKVSKRLLKLIAKAPSYDDLPDKWKNKYDPSGLKIIRRKAESQLKRKRGKSFKCSYCGKCYANFYSKATKSHDETRGGHCPKRSIEQNFKPFSITKTPFFRKNF